MELGLGKLQWTPDVFWGSSLLELTAAAHGLAKLHGTEDEDGVSTSIKPLSTVEMKALQEKLHGQ